MGCVLSKKRFVINEMLEGQVLIDIFLILSGSHEMLC